MDSALTAKMDLFRGLSLQNFEWKLYRIDWYLLVSLALLLGIGTVMIASASMEHGERMKHDASYFLNRHFMYLALSFVGGVVCFKFPMAFWSKLAPWLLVLAIVLLAIVLIPGVGLDRNGGRRWLPIAGFTLQVSEVAKFALIMYLASYLVRQRALVTTTFVGFLNPLIVISVIVVLLLAEPDLSASVVLLTVSLGLLFLGGVKVLQFSLLMIVSLASMTAMIFTEGYRRDRFFALLDPWSDRQGDGYQIIESLIAFGRGEWFGSGLGNGMQKQFYLPEAHNDFIFAVLSEELGFFGSVLVIALFALLLYRLVSIARSAECMGEFFNAFFCYGVALLLFVQLVINVGVNVGLLPPTGLTLPFISYGGTSLLVTCCLLAVVFRVNQELVALLGEQNERKGLVVNTTLSVRQMR